MDGQGENTAGAPQAILSETGRHTRPAFRPMLLRLRHACAWTLLAVFAIGGTVAPDVHRVAHGLERAAILAAHAHDGHHGGAQSPQVREACTLHLVDDTACALCQGTSASVVASTETVGPEARRAPRAAPSEAIGRSRGVAANEGRGPPEGVV